MIHRRRQINITVTALLLGGWLSVVCQICLAHLDQDHQPAQTSESSHCGNTSGHESIDFNNDACDCDAVATGITSIAQHELHNFKLAALALHGDRTRSGDVAVSSPRNSRSPGFPALSPIDTFRVQIK